MKIARTRVGLGILVVVSVSGEVREWMGRLSYFRLVLFHRNVRKHGIALSERVSSYIRPRAKCL